MSLLGLGIGLLGGGGLIGAAIAFIPGAGAVVGRIVAGALAFLSKLPPWVFAVAAALLFALWCLHGKHVAEAKIPALKQQAANSHAAFLAEKKAFAIEKASLDEARHHIDENNRRILAAAVDLDRAKKDAAAADVRNDKLARSTDARIAALRSAATQHKVPCTLSNEARKELEDQ